MYSLWYSPVLVIWYKYEYRNNNGYTSMIDKKQQSALVMGETTTLAKNSPNFASLRTTIPMSMVRQWQLQPGDQLDWQWKVIDGEMLIVIRKKHQPEKKSKK